MSTSSRMPKLIVAVIIGALWFVPVTVLSQETGSDAPPDSGKVSSVVIPDYRLPEKMTICGEKIPLDNRDVYERMDYEFLLAIHSRLQVFLWLRRAGRFFPYIEKRLAAEGLPDDIKYLAVAESDLRPTARSIAKAEGVWQFMGFTGKKYGLIKTKKMDERRHFERSTEAAIKYLKRLKSMFGSWTLAMAAYNCGEGCVGKAVKEQQVQDYFRLALPTETERYVLRIAAIKLILENPKKFGYHMDPGLAYEPIARDSVTVDTDKEIHITQAAKAIGTDYKVIKDLNPWILGAHLPEGRYDIFVPEGSGAKMKAFLSSATPSTAESTSGGTPKPSSAAKTYTVKRGDTLYKISKNTGVPVETLRSLNGIYGNDLLVGQKIVLSR